MDQKPMVSVVMITYNHEKYIEQAINGVLVQNCDFNIELIIVDDSSTDTTGLKIGRAINRQHLQKNVKIRFYRHDENLGVKLNFIWAHNKVKGKYIAYCEGDDVWIDSNKLKKQVEFLEKNSDYSMVFSNINTIDAKGQIKGKSTLKSYKEVFTHSDFPFYCPSPTRVYRNYKFYDELLNIELVGIDTFMLANLSRFGKIRFLSKVSSNYRIHEKGFWNSMNAINKYSEYINTHLVCLDFIETKAFKKNLLETSKRLFKIKKISLDDYYSQLEQIRKCYLNKLKNKKFQIFMFNFFLIIVKSPLIDNKKIKLIRKIIHF
jgi:glycosyltransferase involved in cell wall biosynthesis